MIRKPPRDAVAWAAQFDAVALHLDVDLIDFEDFPLAENTRRKEALAFETVMTSLKILMSAPNLAALTVTEVNPDHDPGGNLDLFCARLSDAVLGGLAERSA